MAIEAGTRMGPYEIVSPLGSGGMGDVWRARDARLERSVAIKVLPEQLAKDDHFRQRFEREARTVSQLSHAHICTLFDVGEEDGQHYIVMELLEGESLADRLARGPLPLHEVLRFGSQIARALDAAHRSGITHRDLKPGNVMLTKSGAKLLDFGLAKSGSDAPAAVSNLTSLPTEARPLTEQGTILGTFQYMAPEQLEGETVDARTDIFALGALVYEMATGQRAFQGANKTTLIAAIVSSHPTPVSAVVSTLPPALDHVIRRCLEKDPDDRWQSAQDVASQLQWIGEAGSQAGSPAAVTLKRKTRERLAWAAAVVGLVAAIGAWIVAWVDREPPREVMRFSMMLPEGTRLAFDQYTSVALSPDGHRQVMVVRRENGPTQLALKEVDSLDARLVPGTEQARAPFFSPDGDWIAFFSEAGLSKVAVAGGPPIVVAPGSFGTTRGGAWSDDGTIVFSPSTAGGLKRVQENGGMVEDLTIPDPQRQERTHRWPAALPGGHAVLFTSDTAESTEFYDDARIEAVSLVTGERVVLLEQSSRAEYLPDGHLLFARGGSLFAVSFDAERLEVRGAPELVLQEVATEVASGAAQFSASRAGSLLYVRGSAAESVNRPVRLDRDGNETELDLPENYYFALRLSDDDRRLAVVMTTGVGSDIWVADLERDGLNRVTFDASADYPVWSPDGQWIAYAALAPGASGSSIFRRRADGGGSVETIWGATSRVVPLSYSPDGKLLLVAQQMMPSGWSDIWVVPVSGDGEPIRFTETPYHESMGSFSPDGRFIAYDSTENGQLEVYVRPFPGPGGRWQISNGGGFEPRWSGDGTGLYFRWQNTLFAATVDTKNGFQAGRAAPVLDGLPPVADTYAFTYAVSNDGQSVYLMKGVDSGDRVRRAALLLNWADEVARLTAR